ncbi:MFS transporter [Kutzneria sp. NPDC052558]|uniref:MFS transporter n=1 Tax=Kutzneria sp. NPDC052558 TaxID=3364121 RepID=UPI0037C7F6B0
MTSKLDTETRPEQHPGRLFTPGLALFNVGAYMALLTPVRLTLPLKVADLVGDQHKAAAFGLVAAVAAVFAIVCGPLAGRLSDRTVSRFGMRRPWMVGGAVGAVLSAVLIATAGSLWQVVLGWCLATIFINSAQAAANATVADQVPPQRRGLVSGIAGLGTSIAILTGSLVVDGFQGDIARFVVPSAIMVVCTALFVLCLKDRRLTERPAPFSLKEFAGSFVFNPRKNPNFGWLWLGRFAIQFGNTGVLVYFVYLLTDRFGLAGSALTGTVVLVNLGATATAILSSYLMGWWSDRAGRRKPFVAAGSLLIALGLVLMAFAPDANWVIVASAIAGLGSGGFLAVDLALATQVLPSRGDTAKDLGVLMVTNPLPQSVVPIIAPAVIAVGAATIGGYTLLFLLAAVIAVLGAACVYRIKGVN